MLLTARENPGILRSTAIIKRYSQDSQDPGKTEDSGCTSIRMSHESTCGEAGCISDVLTMRDSCSLTVVKPGKVVVNGRRQSANHERRDPGVGDLVPSWLAISGIDTNMQHGTARS